MTDVTAKKFEDVPAFEGPQAIPGIRFRRVGRALSVGAWGMNVIEIAAGCAGYPEHDHTKDGQEEVYIVLEGSGTLAAGGNETKLGRGSFVRVGPAVRRKVQPGPEGIVLLVLGATPGQAYRPRS